MINEHEHERALIFLERKTKVHILRNDGIFYNGLILEVGDKFFVILDKVSGKEQFIFFSELKKPLEPYTEVGEWNQKNKLK